MNSVIEKITLYDLFGYLIPGLVFIILVCAGPVYDYKEVREYLVDCTGIIVSLGILLGFVVGMIISEIARMLFSGWVYLMRRIFQKEADSQDLMKVMNKYTGIDVDVLKKAIKRSGIPNSQMSLEQMLGVMYGDIQIDTCYSRIHGYSSSEVLCKNMVVSILAGGIIESIYLVWYNHSVSCRMMYVCGAIWVFTIYIFARRYKKFKRKKEQYTILWFVQKYLSGTKFSN